MAIVICASIATGKSSVSSNERYAGRVAEIEMSTYKKILTDEQKKMCPEELKSVKAPINPNWEQEYFAAIEDAASDPNIDYVLVAKENAVDLCQAKGIEYWRAYPALDCKQEYLERCKGRGNKGDFIKLLEENWEELHRAFSTDEKASRHVELGKGQVLLHALDEYEASKKKVDGTEAGI